MRPTHARYVTACQQLLALGVVLAVLTPAASVVTLEVVLPRPADSSSGPSGGSLGTHDRAGAAPAPAPHGSGPAAGGAPAVDAGDRPAPARPAAPAPVAEPEAGPAQLPAEAVRPRVREVALTDAEGEAKEPEAESDPRPAPAPEEEPEAGPAPEADEEPEAGPAPEAAEEPGPEPEPALRTTLVSEPQPVAGYGVVGVTWSAGSPVDEEAITFEARSYADGAWGAWAAVEYHDDHMADPGSAEAAGERPGTDALVIGDVDRVQLRVRSEDGLPADMSLAVVDPGDTAATTVEGPAIDTATLGGADAGTDPAPAGEPEPAGAADEGTTPGEPAPEETAVPQDDGVEEAGVEEAGAEEAIALQATTFTPKPRIFSRAQWGADESLRDRGSLRYYEVHAGFVHHTVNGNDYSRAQVPSILRGIYAYHTRSRGWSDIGYNFLVDKFGRIWEGRAGGVDRPVVGAHTFGYNDYAFAMSAIGNFDVARPPERMLRAYGRLFAWKLSLHGVDPTSTSQRVGSRTFPAVNGHRDAGTTACPGRYLYARLPAIRGYAAEARQSWSGRNREVDVAANRYPDLIVRRESDNRAMVVPTGGLLRALPAKDAGEMPALTTAVATPDVDGDGHADLLVRRTDGIAELRPGTGSGAFGSPARRYRGFRRSNLIAATGDLTGDGTNDLVTRTNAGTLVTLSGRGDGYFSRQPLDGSWSRYDVITGVGDVTGDGKADLVTRAAGVLELHPGTGTGRFGAPTVVRRGYGGYDVVTGVGDWNSDGLGDLLLRKRSGGTGYVLPSRGDGRFGHRLGPIGNLSRIDHLTSADVVGSGQVDAVGVRNGRLLVRRNKGTYDAGTPIVTDRRLGWARDWFNAGDWDRDGNGDMVVRSRTGVLRVFLGNGNGQFPSQVLLSRGFDGVQLLAAVGDVTGDGYPDLMGQPSGRAMRIYPGRGTNGLGSSYVARSNVSANLQMGAGRWDGDGSPDSLFRVGSRLRFQRGNGPGGLTGGMRDLDIDVSRYDWVVAISDARGAGHPDLVVRTRNGRLWLLPGRVDGFGSRRFLGEGMNVYDGHGG